MFPPPVPPNQNGHSPVATPSLNGATPAANLSAPPPSSSVALNPFHFNAPPAVMALSPSPLSTAGPPPPPGARSPFFPPQLIYWPYPSPPISPTSYYGGLANGMLAVNGLAPPSGPASPIPNALVCQKIKILKHFLKTFFGPSTHKEEFAKEYSTKNFSSSKIFF